MRTFVIGTHVVRLRTRPLSPRLAAVDIDLNSSRRWTGEIEAWAPLGFGFGPDEFYFWSPRRLFVFDFRSDGPPAVMAFDEDVLFPFRWDEGWLAVMETSVRLLRSGVELSRLELGEIVTDAFVTANGLVLRDGRGSRLSVTVDHDRLVAAPS